MTTTITRPTPALCPKCRELQSGHVEPNVNRHVLTEQPRDPLHTHLHYVGQARAMRRGGEPATHVTRCPHATENDGMHMCGFEPRMVGRVLVRATGVKVAIATREMRAGVQA